MLFRSQCVQERHAYQNATEIGVREIVLAFARESVAWSAEARCTHFEVHTEQNVLQDARDYEQDVEHGTKAIVVLPGRGVCA